MRSKRSVFRGKYALGFDQSFFILCAWNGCTRWRSESWVVFVDLDILKSAGWYFGFCFAGNAFEAKCISNEVCMGLLSEFLHSMRVEWMYSLKKGIVGCVV